MKMLLFLSQDFLKNKMIHTDDLTDDLKHVLRATGKSKSLSWDYFQSGPSDFIGPCKSNLASYVIG